MERGGAKQSSQVVRKKPTSSLILYQFIRHPSVQDDFTPSCRMDGREREKRPVGSSPVGEGVLPSETLDPD